jgi:hypothetical protein
MRYLLNQSMDSKTNNLLMRVWLPMALILTWCFTGGILTKIISPENLVINTFEEMIDSGVKIYTNNGSWIWHQFNNKNQWNKTLDYKMSMLENRIEFTGGPHNMRSVS